MTVIGRRTKPVMCSRASPLEKSDPQNQEVSGDIRPKADSEKSSCEITIDLKLYKTRLLLLTGFNRVTRLFPGLNAIFEVVHFFETLGDRVSNCICRLTSITGSIDNQFIRFY